MTRIIWFFQDRIDNLDRRFLHYRFARWRRGLGWTPWYEDDQLLAKLAYLVPLLIARAHETPHDHVMCFVCEHNWWANEPPDHAPDCPVPLLEKWEARRQISPLSTAADTKQRK